MPARVTYIVRSWPRLSQTFVLHEVLALERRGVELDIFSLCRSGERLVQPQVADVRAPVSYLDDIAGARFGWLRDHLVVALAEPARYARAALFAWTRPALARGYATCTTLSCFSHAVRVVAALRRRGQRLGPAGHVHAHFAHDPALVALLVRRLTGAPYTFTAHARDLYQIPVSSLVARVEGAEAVLTCCAANVEYLTEALPATLLGRVALVPHGVDTAQFRPSPRPRDPGPVRLLSIGRLVEKKGFPDLLRACARIPAADFRLRIYGDGPLRAELTALRDRLGLQDRVELMGERDAEAITAAYADADIFVLTPLVTADGDRDGIPNVVVEAMACGLPVVATAAGGVTEVVSHGHTGLIAAVRAVDELAGHLEALIADRPRRESMGRAGRAVVERGYDVDVAAGRVAAVFRIAELVAQ